MQQSIYNEEPQGARYLYEGKNPNLDKTDLKEEPYMNVLHIIEIFKIRPNTSTGISML